MKDLILVQSLILTVMTALAQNTGSYAGSWEGKLNPGVELRIVFHIKDEGAGKISALADSPDQSAYGLTCDTAFIDAGGLTIEMKALRASYKGKLVGDTLIEGIFNQGISMPLNLKKAGTTTARVRPQTPKPPFPYTSEEVRYKSKNPSVTLAATITIPEGKGPFPAALLITGSGPQNRDEELMGHKPFEVLADYLSRQGFIVLRADDRGIGKSTGDFTKATSADFADDVHGGVEYLLSRPEVDRKKIGLIGHSEGGMIAPMVAASRKDLDYIVLLAGPGVKISRLMEAQNAAVLKSSGVSEAAINTYLPFYSKMMNLLVNETDSIKARDAIRNTLQEFISKTDTAILSELNLKDSTSHNVFLKTMDQQFKTPWSKYFLKFDPEPYLSKLKCKVLAINGERDIQVLPSQNLMGIEKALRKSKTKTWETAELQGLNHLFQQCSKCTVQEYQEIDETISPVALEYVGNWLNTRVK